MRERDLQESTRKMLKGLKLSGEVAKFFHPFSSKRSQPGFPDWIIAIRRELVIAVELKSEKGKLTKDQQEWKYLLGKRWHLARSLDEFADILRSYGVTVNLSRKP